MPTIIECFAPGFSKHDGAVTGFDQLADFVVDFGCFLAFAIHGRTLVEVNIRRKGILVGALIFQREHGLDVAPFERLDVEPHVMGR